MEILLALLTHHELGELQTCMVSRVLSNSRGYVQRVELTPANAPATRDEGTGSLGGSPILGVKILLAVSKANNCKKEQYQKRVSGKI